MLMSRAALQIYHSISIALYILALVCISNFILHNYNYIFLKLLNFYFWHNLTSPVRFMYLFNNYNRAFIDSKAMANHMRSQVQTRETRINAPRAVMSSMRVLTD